MDFIHSLGISLLYLTLLGIGVIYAILILIFGALHDIHIPGFEMHVGDHSLGPFDLSSTPDATLSDVSHPSVKIPSLSPIAIASFVTAFGAFGLISLGLFEVSYSAQPGMGLCGWFGYCCDSSFRFWFFPDRPQGSSEIHLRDIIGTLAEVTTPIPADSVGEVALVAQGGRITYTAKSSSGTPIVRGATVVIEKVIGGIALVRPQ